MKISNIKDYKVVIFLLTLILLSCSNIEHKKELPRVRYAHQLLDGDNKEFYGCALLINISKWKESEYWENSWYRSLSFRFNDGVTQLEKAEPIFNENDETTSDKLKSSKQHALIYIGKWHHIKRLGIDIRLVGYQILHQKNISHGTLKYMFESRNKENEKIKEMKFSPIVEIPYLARSHRARCIIKWYDKYGYNAYAKTKRVWHESLIGKLFLQRQLVVTGKVIQAEE